MERETQSVGRIRLASWKRWYLGGGWDWGLAVRRSGRGKARQPAWLVPIGEKLVVGVESCIGTLALTGKPRDGLAEI